MRKSTKLSSEIGLNHNIQAKSHAYTVKHISKKEQTLVDVTTDLDVSQNTSALNDF